MNKNTLKAAIKNHSEAVKTAEDPIAYLVGENYTEEEAKEILEAINSTEETEVEKPSKKEDIKLSEHHSLYEVWKCELVNGKLERNRVLKTVKAEPNKIEILNEQKFNTLIEYVKIK